MWFPSVGLYAGYPMFPSLSVDSSLEFPSLVLGSGHSLSGTTGMTKERIVVPGMDWTGPSHKDVGRLPVLRHDVAPWLRDRYSCSLIWPRQRVPTDDL